jgi:hypothetical protein
VLSMRRRRICMFWLSLTRDWGYDMTLSYIAAMTPKNPRTTNAINIQRHHICLLFVLDVRAAPNQRFSGLDALHRHEVGLLCPTSTSFKLVALELWLTVSSSSSRNVFRLEESPLIVLRCTGQTVTMTSDFFSWPMVNTRSEENT